MIRYNPDKGILPEECFDLDGNPSLETDWPRYTLRYTDEQGEKSSMELSLTFADFAVTEARFRKQFRTVPRDAWNDNMVALDEYLELDGDGREGKFPYIWAVNAKNRLIRVIPAAPIVRSCEDRRNFWRVLKSLAGVREPVAEPDIEQIRAEVTQTLMSRLMEFSGTAPARVAVLPSAPVAAANGDAAEGDYIAPWIDSAQCTSCDECIGINSKIFAYDERKHAYVKNPKGGSYKDLVRAAEKCTAQVIHPGTPFDSKEKDLDKLIQRAARYN